LVGQVGMGGSRKAHPRLPLRPNSRVRRGAWAAGRKNAVPRGLTGPGSSSPGGCGLSGLGCNATRRQTNVPKQRGVPTSPRRRSGCCPPPAAKQRQPVRLATLPRVGTLREADKGRRGPAHLPLRLLHQRHDAERAPRRRQAPRERLARQRQCHARGLPPVVSRAAGGSMSLLRS
jgi:hypothetical protein